MLIFQCENLSEQLEAAQAQLNSVKSELHIANMDRHKVRAYDLLSRRV